MPVNEQQEALEQLEAQESAQLSALIGTSAAAAALAGLFRTFARCLVYTCVLATALGVWAMVRW